MTRESRRVVWLDDEPESVAGLVRSVRSNAEFDVQVVRRGTQALREIADDPSLALLVVDLLLRDDARGSGLQIAEVARAMMPSLPIVAVTEHLAGFSELIVYSLATRDYPFAAIWEKDSLQSPTAVQEFTEALRSLMDKQSPLQAVCGQFEALLDQNPAEEQVQQFMESNPLVLHQFSPDRVFFKSPILTTYKTDIAVLTSKRELLLIELERPSTRLLKKDGGIAATMQHALDQVRDWLHMIDEHRAAVLKCLNLQPEEVSTIRGVVILGRDRDYRGDHLRKLKWTDFGRIAFFTYDDLLRSLVNLTRMVTELWPPAPSLP